MTINNSFMFQLVTNVISEVQLSLVSICFALVHLNCMLMHCSYLPPAINWFTSHNSLRLPKHTWRSGAKTHRICQFWEKAKRFYSTTTETGSNHHINTNHFLSLSLFHCNYSIRLLSINKVHELHIA